MLPTPDTSHVPYTHVYEPSEDSFLLLDTLSSLSETTFLTGRFGGDDGAAAAALVVEIGPGSGVVLAFIAAHATTLLGAPTALVTGVDINPFASAATAATVQKAIATAAADDDRRGNGGGGVFLGTLTGDLAGPLRAGCVDVLVFNPPYVPTEAVPPREGDEDEGGGFESQSRLLALAYAGGRDGMETTDRLLEALPSLLSPRGCAYVLLCAQNRPDDVKARICLWGREWRAETVGTSGKMAGRERLVVVRAWRELDSAGG